MHAFGPQQAGAEAEHVDMRGTARMSYDASEHTVDLSVGPGALPRIGPLEWNGMALSGQGSFKHEGGADNRVEGRLYGPQFEEAGGVFVHGDYTGAFGLSRDP